MNSHLFFFAIFGIFVSLLSVWFPWFKIDSIVVLFAVIGLGISSINKLKGLEKANKEKGGEVYIENEMRGDVVAEKLTNASKKIWIMTSWLPIPEKFKAAIEKNSRATKKKFDLKIMVGDKYVIRQRAGEVGETSWETKYSANVDLSRDFPGKLTFLPMAVHKLCFIIDDEIFYSPFFFKEQAVKSPSMYMKTDSTIGKALQEEFIKLWKRFHRNSGHVDYDVLRERINPCIEKLKDNILFHIPYGAFEMYVIDPGNPEWLTLYPDQSDAYRIGEDMTGIVIGRGYPWRVQQLRKVPPSREGKFHGMRGPWMGVPMIIQKDRTDAEFLRVGVVRLTRGHGERPFTLEEEIKCEELVAEVAPEINSVLIELMQGLEKIGGTSK